MARPAEGEDLGLRSGTASPVPSMLRQRQAPRVVRIGTTLGSNHDSQVARRGLTSANASCRMCARWIQATKTDRLIT